MIDTPQPATEGRIVHVRTPGVSHCQPAMVVRNWGGIHPGALNVAIFRDGSNDSEMPPFAPSERSAMVKWATSVAYREAEDVSDTQQTWHWPERV